MYLKKKDFKKNTKIILTIVLDIYSIVFISTYIEEMSKPDLKNYNLNKYVIAELEGSEQEVFVNLSIDEDAMLNEYSDLEGIELYIYSDKDSFENVENDSSIIVEYTIKCLNSNQCNSTSYYYGKTQVEVNDLKTVEEIEKEQELIEKEKREEEERLEKERKKEEERIKKEEKLQSEIDNASFGEQQALDKAQSYIDYSAFSKEGLYEQLKFEGFTKKEARFAVNHIGVSWKKQAVLKGEQYLDYSSFSKQGLYNQLIFEKFTSKQAQYAVDKLF